MGWNASMDIRAVMDSGGRDRDVESMKRWKRPNRTECGLGSVTSCQFRLIDKTDWVTGPVDGWIYLHCYALQKKKLRSRFYRIHFSCASAPLSLYNQQPIQRLICVKN